MTSTNQLRRQRLFLASDRLWPSAINHDYPDAQFIARCRLTSDAPMASAFASIPPTSVWGVMIETTAIPQGSKAVTLVDDFGTAIDAVTGPDELLAGDPESLYMASRYWELHPAYIQQMRVVLQSRGLETSDEEPKDDGALASPGSP